MVARCPWTAPVSVTGATVAYCDSSEAVTASRSLMAVLSSRRGWASAADSRSQGS
jgi:hypothetical protein